MTGPVTTEALVEKLAHELARLDGWQDPNALWTDNLGIIARGGEGSPVYLDYVEDARALVAGPLAPFLASLQQVTAERDEADRRAGAAEREAESDRESTRKRNSWLHQAKLQAGYSTGVSFDKVWAETLEKAGSADTANAELARLRAEGEAKDRALTEIAKETEMGLAPYEPNPGTQAFEWRERPSRAAQIALDALAARAATAREE